MLQRQIKDLILSLTCDVKQEGFSAGIHLDRQLLQYSPDGDVAAVGAPRFEFAAPLGRREWTGNGIQRERERHQEPALSPVSCTSSSSAFTSAIGLPGACRACQI